MRRIFKAPVAKEGELVVGYGEESLIYCHRANGVGMRRDARMLTLAFERTPLRSGETLRKELEDRGYDIKTLKFSIMKKQ